MSVLFDYEVSPRTVYITTQDQHPSTAQLAITITNRTGEDVQVKYFGFIIPIPGGNITQATALTNDAGSISASALPADDWNISVGGQPNSFKSNSRVLKANASATFLFNGIHINKHESTANIQVVEATAQGQPKQILPITKLRSKLAIKSFTVRPVSIKIGEMAKLSWETASASEVKLHTKPQGPAGPEEKGKTPPAKPAPANPGDDQRCSEDEVQTVALSGSCEASPRSTTLYILEARGAGPVMTDQLLLPVDNVEIIFEASKQNIIAGDTLFLKWSTTYADHATLNPGSIPVPLQMPDKEHPQGWPLKPAKDITYVLHAQGANSGKDASLAVTVTPKVEINSFSGRAFDRR